MVDSADNASKRDLARMNSLKYRRGAQQRAIDADRESRELAEKKATTKRSTSKK